MRSIWPSTRVRTVTDCSAVTLPMPVWMTGIARSCTGAVVTSTGAPAPGPGGLAASAWRLIVRTAKIASAATGNAIHSQRRTRTDSGFIGTSRGASQRRGVGRVPVTADRLDQRHAGNLAAAVQLRRGALVGERRGLRDHHAEVGCGAGTVLVERQPLGQLQIGRASCRERV